MTSWGAFYGAGAVMGFSPSQVREMTIWEFAHARGAFAGFHSPESIDKTADASPEAIEAALALYDAAPNTVT